MSQEYFAIDGAPDIPGLRFRHYRGEEDIPLAHAVAERETASNKQEHTFTLEDMVRFYRHLSNCDLTKDMLIAEVGARVAAYSRAWWIKIKPTGFGYGYFVCVSPELENSGLRLAMARWNETRLREIAAGHESGEAKSFDVFLEDLERGMIAVLESEGYKRIRYSYLMTRSLKGPLPERRLPDGLEVRPVRPEDYRMLWDADVDACLDAWEPIVVDESRYQGWLDNAQFQPGLWQIAWDGDDIAGAVQNYILEDENQKFKRRRGYTENIHVGRRWRGKGVAKALIASSFHILKERGMDEAALGVDAMNPTGALRLYESMGFKPVRKYYTYRKPL